MPIEMHPEIKKDWDKFLEYIFTQHQISRKAWMPNYQTIKLWEEFRGRIEKQ